MSFVDRSLLITGGAGFIGTNLAHRALLEGARVVVFDDLSRPGVAANIGRLRALHPDGRLTVRVADIRDAQAVRQVLGGVDAVFHLAAQVAVTTSVAAPRHDFEVNLRGTVTLLEEIRRLADPPSLLFTSTNKVYGSLPDVATERRGQRHHPQDEQVRRAGISERRPLDFCSPYGCSKGGADQYVLDYAKTYGLQASVFRMSCIYGPHQCGTEDQGWVAHFMLQAARGQTITIYGDGGQVRDVLFVDDLVDAMDVVMNDSSLAGQAFNMGGGPANTLGLLELLTMIEQLEGRRPAVQFRDWRIGDQRWYVSDTQRFQSLTGWTPKIGVADGVARLHRWLAEHAPVHSMAESL